MAILFRERRSLRYEQGWPPLGGGFHFCNRIFIFEYSPRFDFLHIVEFKGE